MQGRVVIVTGGAKGIGRYAAHTLAKAGAKVVLADADVERMHKTLGEIHRLNAEALAIPTMCATRRMCDAWFMKLSIISVRSTL